MLTRVLVIVVAAVSLIALLTWLQRRSEPAYVSGFVEADEIRLGSRVGGRVKEVLIQEGQTVRPGQVLVRLEPFDLLDRRAEAAAELERAAAEYDRLSAGFRQEEIAQAAAQRDRLKANLALLKAGPRPQEIRAAEARLESAKAEQQLAEQDYERILKTFRVGASTKAEMDRASEQQNATRAMTNVRELELAILEEGSREEEILGAEAQLAEAEALWEMRRAGFRPQEIAQAKAAKDAAAAKLEVIDRQIAELEIKAPLEGDIEAMELQPGDLVSPSAPVLSMMDTRRKWIRAYVPESRLALSLGQKLKVKIDAFPGVDFVGTVQFVARQGEFTPSNVQTREDRSEKLVFRIKIDIADPEKRLRPGMAGDVYLE